MASNIVCLKIADLDVPLRIVKEWRRSVRISIGKKHVILRLPTYYGSDQVYRQIEWAKEWLISQFVKDVSLTKQFKPKGYKTGDHLSINGKNYFLKIIIEDRKTNSGKLKSGVIYIKLSKDLDPYQEGEVVEKLISRIVAEDNHAEVSNRIHKLNEKFFNKPIKSIKLKNNSSNWGSCSSSGNLNISTRLLFAPQEVQDYVFVHELAHLIELNHSKEFWSIVEDIMPDYKEKEKWLKKNNHLCNF